MCLCLLNFFYVEFIKWNVAVARKTRKKEINRLVHLPPTIFFTTQREKMAKETNKTWKIGKNAHVTKEYNFNYGSTLQSITIKLRFGIVSPSIDCCALRIPNFMYSIPKSMDSSLLFSFSSNFSMNFIFRLRFSLFISPNINFSVSLYTFGRSKNKSKILALVFSRLDLIKYSFHLIRWKFSVWLVTEKHLFHNDGRRHWCESGHTETWINSFFISSGANTHSHTASANIHVLYSHLNRFELVLDVLFSGDTVSLIHRNLFTLNSNGKILIRGIFVTKFSISNFKCMFTHSDTYIFDAR